MADDLAVPLFATAVFDAQAKLELDDATATVVLLQVLCFFNAVRAVPLSPTVLGEQLADAVREYEAHMAQALPTPSSEA